MVLISVIVAYRPVGWCYFAWFASLFLSLLPFIVVDSLVVGVVVGIIVVGGAVCCCLCCSSCCC